MRFRKLRLEELHRLTPRQYAVSPHTPGILLLDNIRSLQNVGAMLRTVDCLGLESVSLCGFTGHPPHREIHRTALGAELSVPWQHFDNAHDALRHHRERGYAILALEQCEGSLPLERFTLPPDRPGFVLMVGNEVDGLQQSLASAADQCLEITQHGTKHSLNVATAAGIALWHLHQLYTTPQ